MKKKRFAGIVAGLDKEYQREYMTGLAQQLRQKGDDLFLFACQGFPQTGHVINEEAESRIFDLPDLSRFDGIVSLTRTLPMKELEVRMEQRLAGLRHIPQVTVDEENPNVSSINFDDAGSIRMMMQHMIRVHHCHTFALVRGPVENAVADWRDAACREVIEANGCMVVLEVDGRWTREGGRKAAEEIMKLKLLPDAAICCNDDAACALIDTLQSHGIKVPQQIRVTGVDARRDALARGITTIHRPVDIAGEISARLLQKGETGKTMVMPTRLMCGTSCGCTTATYPLKVFDQHAREEEMSLSMLHAVAFTSRMAAARDLRQAGEAIKNFAESWGCEELYLVIDPAVLKTSGEDPEAEDETRLSPEKTPDRMLLVAGVNGDTAEMGRVFDRNDLLPGLQEREQPVSLAFFPLYYQKRMLGYMALDLKHAFSSVLLPITTLIECALMEFVQRSTIQDYVKALEVITYHDPLTGLFNRRGFTLRAEELLREAIETKKELAVISIDLDGMKQINDRWGHMYGDEALVRMGRAMETLTSEPILLSHMSGDEFMICALKDKQEEARQVPAMLQAALDRINRDEKWVCDVKASMGLYCRLPKEGDELSEFIRLADNRMYENKRKRHAMYKKQAEK